ncbi:MAG: hypothetical protein ACRBN8_34060 [Nannocystales bacterium]
MAFDCHNCGANTHNNQRRKGPCTICFSKKVSFCQTCAAWELGPPAPSLQDELRPRTRKRVGTVIKHCPAVAVVRDAAAVNLIADLRGLCLTVDGQWANHGFDADGNNRGGAYGRDGAYNHGGRPRENNQAPGFHCQNSDAADGQFGAVAQSMLDDFDNLYARQEPLGGGGNAAKSEDDLERTMLVALASAHERCGYVNDYLIHRWDAPTLAAEHFTACFDAYGAIAGAACRALAPVVLRSTILEDLVYGKLSVSYAYWRVREEVAGPADRGDFVRLAAMLLHLWLKNAPVGPMAAPVFLPVGGRGLVTPQLRAATLTGNGEAFRAPIEKKIAALYASFGAPAPHLPAVDRRFPDAGIHGDALLNNRQKRFLQSLPPMDHAHRGVALTPCEGAIRARIRKMFRRIRGAFQGGAPYPGAVTQAMIAANNDVTRDAVIDRMVANFHKGLNWIETSSSETPYAIYHGLGPVPKANFGFISFADGNIVNVPWSHAFPDCMGLVAATYAGQGFVPDMLRPAVVQDGRQNARRWYSEWRWDKDHRLYGAHGFQGDERGKVAQFSFHPGAPYPNAHYGRNTVVWDPAVLPRAVLVVGDKGRPMRSMTILLHDILTRVPDVVGDPGPACANTLRALLEWMDANDAVNPAAYVAVNGPNAFVTGPPPPAAPTTPRTVLLDRVRGTVDRHALFDFSDGTDSAQRQIMETMPNLPLATIIECHIFGRTALHHDAMLVIKDEADAIAPGPAPGTALNAVRPCMASLHGGAQPYNTARYRGAPAALNIALWRNTRPNPLPDPAPDALEGIVSKVPKYS